MKPLSALYYSRNNKKKLITSVISILIAVVFLYDLQTLVSSMLKTMYKLNISPYKIHMTLYNDEKTKPISEDIIASLENNSNVEKLVPFIPYKTRYVIPGSRTNAIIWGLNSEDMYYVMKRHSASLSEGRLPKEGTREVALDSQIAKNKKVKIGDKIGNSVNKNDSLDGEYLVVGLLNSNDYLSLMPYIVTFDATAFKSDNIIKNSLLVFPKENKLKEVDDLLLSFPKDKVRVSTFSERTRDFDKEAGVVKTLDMICMISIIVMVISVGSSKYVQFFSRKPELGVLNAIGYTKVQIMKKAFSEVLLINFLGFVLGFGFGLLFSLLINNGILKNVGAEAVYFSTKAFLIALYIPLFTTLFTLIPVNRMINKLDPIVMIEGI